MIRIHRPPNAPRVLLTEGAERRREHEADHDADPAAYRSGTRRHAFDRSVYGHGSVKGALIVAQGEKCAFCESKPLHVSDGDVEHFRPKAAVRQEDDDPLEYPGYYWLAYDWGNLLFSCERCNRRHKQNLFPLVDPAGRARSHHAHVAEESTVFVDPSVEDPELHVGFREHVPLPLSVRGDRTIRALGLGRPELNRDREEHLERLRVLFQVATHPDVPENLRADARRILAKNVAPRAEYSLMCRLAVAGWEQTGPR